MRDVYLKLTMSDEEAAMFEGRWSMVVPLTEAELHELRDLIHESAKFGAVVRKTVSTLSQVLERDGDAEGHIRKTLAMLLEPSDKIKTVHERMFELLGRARFAAGEGNDERGPLQ